MMVKTLPGRRALAVFRRSLAAIYCATAAIAGAASVPIPYLENFDASASSFTAAATSGTAWTYSGGKFHAAITSSGVSAAATVQTPALTQGFRLETTVSSVTSGHTENTCGVGFLGADATFTGSGAPYYLADIKPGQSSIRLVKVSSSNIYLVDNESLSFPLDPALPFNILVEGSYEGPVLRIDLTVTQGSQRSVHAVEDDEPVTGNYFGLRCRTNGGTPLQVDYDDFSLRTRQTMAFTAPPARFAKPGVNYSTAVTATSLTGAPVTFLAEQLPEWLSIVAVGPDTVILGGTPPAGGAGVTSIRLRANDGSSLPLIEDFPLTVLGVSGVVISEFMASSDGSLLDEDGDDSDWLELFNADPTSVDLSGWILKDDQTSWTLPQGTVLPGYGSRIVFASDKNRSSPNLHTNFKLSSSAGGYLALARPDGSIAYAYTSYPAQREGISYGTWGDYQTTGYLLTATPAAANAAQGFAGFVSNPAFSIPRGTYTTAQNVTITCPFPGSSLRYTLDGSLPTATHGTLVAAANGATVPSITLPVASTSVIRAVGLFDGYAPSTAITHTYLFQDDIIAQSPDGVPPPGWPVGSVNGQILNYGMDPRITGGMTAEMKAALARLPSISMVTDRDHLFSSATGIYVNAYEREREWERPTSLEMIKPDGTSAFQIDCGMRIRGGVSRDDSNPKHGFHFYFRGEYGAKKLEYPLFDTEGVDEFDRIDLRCTQGGSWHQSNNSGATYMKDEWSRATQGAMGQPYTRSRYVHLYINGQYWGIFTTQERADNAFAASYFGGEKEDYDVIKTYTRPHRVEAADGDAVAWTALHEAATAGFANDAAYFAVQGLDASGQPSPTTKPLVEMDNLIDYMILNFFIANTDGPVNTTPNPDVPKNFYCFRPRDGSAGFRFVAHDCEDTMTNGNTLGPTDAGPTLVFFNPRWLHLRLAENARYRARFADRVQRSLFNTGALAATNAVARWEAIRNHIRPAMLAESARWGDVKSATPHRVSEWESAAQGISATYLPQRPAAFISQLRGVSPPLFPSINAPAFSQFGGVIAPGFSLTITGGSGTQIQYTLDGSDPSAPGSVLYQNPIALNGAAVTVKARARATATGEWSALTEARFTQQPVAAAAGNLVISEVNYNPPGADDLDEFIELWNPSASLVELSGVKLANGVTFTFPALLLEPDQRVVVIKDEAAFRAVYGSGPRVAGIWSGSLNNTGEPIVLLAANGTEIERITYAAALPWPTSANNNGRTLVRIRPELSANLASSWRPSTTDRGSPGGGDGTSLASWLAGHGFADASAAGPGGLKALVYYASGLDPATYASPPVLMTLEPSATKVTVRRKIAAIDDVRVFIEQSSDLASWPVSVEVDGATATLISRTANPDGTESMTLQFPALAGKAFYRVRYITR